MNQRAQRYPSRRYGYGAEADAGLGVAPTLQPGGIYRFVLGRQEAPEKIERDELVASLHDPFATLVLGRGASPKTTAEIFRQVSSFDGSADGLPEQRVFVVADGGLIPWTPATRDLQRSFRFLLTRGAPPAVPPLFVSTVPPFDAEAAFLQVVGWDAIAGAYQFYDFRGDAWIWAGSSWDALADDSRGKGPFDSHVNGALNMKELKAPWVHWHSQAAAIPDEALAPDDPLRTSPLWAARQGAERLEVEIIRPGIERWTSARIERCTKDGRLTRLPELMRQVLVTTTINLVASQSASAAVATGKPVDLPLSFFIDKDGLVDEFGLDPGIDNVPTVGAQVYTACLQQFMTMRTDGALHIPGDVPFAFMVPERALEDQSVLRALRSAGILSDKLAASLLMVDFSNPIFSSRRAALLAYVPNSAELHSSAFANELVARVEAAAAGLPETSPQAEFLANFRLPDAAWRANFEARLRALFEALAPAFLSEERFAPLFKLADSRRREFRRRPLAEFPLTTPFTNIPEDAPFLELTPDGAVRGK